MRFEMSSTKAGTPSILVTDAARGCAVAFIRSLGRRGWRVTAADSHPGGPGLRSRYAGDRLLYPPPSSAPSEFVETLLDAARTRGLDLIVPLTDPAILPLSRARGRFEGVCKLALPEEPKLELAADKHRTVELARSLGVPVPETHLVCTVREAVERAEKLGWPVVLKPRFSQIYREGGRIDSFKVTFAADVADLETRMRPFEGKCDVLLQAHCPGNGQGVELLLDRGRPLAAFQHRRLREVPIHGGASAFRESVALDPTLFAYSMRLMEALEWTGLAMVEFKVGPDGPRLMEINGRVWGSLPLAVHAGVDFPARLVELLLSGPPASEEEPLVSYREGIRSRNLELDLMWIVQVLLGRRRYPFVANPSRREGLRALLQLLNPRHRFDILSLDDPRPGLAEIAKLPRKLRSKLNEA
jgi:predicted ATP-grasp superfamily ATP-dependent carboligase